MENNCSLSRMLSWHNTLSISRVPSGVFYSKNMSSWNADWPQLDSFQSGRHLFVEISSQQDMSNLLLPTYKHRATYASTCITTQHEVCAGTILSKDGPCLLGEPGERASTCYTCVLLYFHSTHARHRHQPQNPSQEDSFSTKTSSPTTNWLNLA